MVFPPLLSDANLDPDNWVDLAHVGHMLFLPSTAAEKRCIGVGALTDIDPESEGKVRDTELKG